MFSGKKEGSMGNKGDVKSKKTKERSGSLGIIEDLLKKRKRELEEKGGEEGMEACKRSNKIVRSPEKEANEQGEKGEITDLGYVAGSERDDGKFEGGDKRAGEEDTKRDGGTKKRIQRADGKMERGEEGAKREHERNEEEIGRAGEKDGEVEKQKERRGEGLGNGKKNRGHGKEEELMKEEVGDNGKKRKGGRI